VWPCVARRTMPRMEVTPLALSSGFSRRMVDPTALLTPIFGDERGLTSAILLTEGAHNAHNFYRTIVSCRFSLKPSEHDVGLEDVCLYFILICIVFVSEGYPNLWYT
jgi:hypothetical protein